jgi:hypothetical protein
MMVPKKGMLVILASFVTVIGFELLLHRLLASSASLRALYLSASKKDSITMIVDIYIPSAILGLVNGWVGYQWSVRRLCFMAAILAGGVLGAVAFYPQFFRQEHLWWWPPHTVDVIFWLLPALVLLGLFTYQGRIFGAWHAAGCPKVRP